jgi:TonB family protein
MASPEKIAPSLPDTLPDDFGGWDSDNSPTEMPDYSWESQALATTTPVYSWETQAPATVEPVKSNEWEAWEAAHSSGKTSKSSAQSAERKAILSPVVDRPHVSDSASSAPVSGEQQKSFTDRGSEATSAAKHVNSDEWAVWAAAHSSSKTTKPLGQSAERKATLSPVADRPRVSASASTASVSDKQPRLTGEPVNGSLSRTSNGTKNGVAVAPSSPNVAPSDAALYELFSSINFEGEEERKTAGNNKKWMIVAAVSASSILLLVILMFSLFHHGTKSAAKQSVQPLPVVTDAQLDPNKQKPRASEPLTQGQTPATAATGQATDNQPASEADGADSAQTPTEDQTKMMNDQLAAPTRIPQGIKTQAAENEPPAGSLGIAGADGLGSNGANEAIFSGHAQPVVKVVPSKPIAISSGVAVGMLIQKTPPLYPLIAKTARVSGTVQLQATISKVGTIKDLHYVNGPEMLRQAALDAVRTWRYQPYKLNNEPTEVETTINVVFTLGG